MAGGRTSTRALDRRIAEIERILAPDPCEPPAELVAYLASLSATQLAALEGALSVAPWPPDGLSVEQLEVIVASVPEAGRGGN
jgi:hypothetical protein